jgi:uncharacterized protein YneF (UPF0154 family)
MSLIRVLALLVIFAVPGYFLSGRILTNTYEENRYGDLVLRSPHSSMRPWICVLLLATLAVVAYFVSGLIVP